MGTAVLVTGGGGTYRVRVGIGSRVGVLVAVGLGVKVAALVAVSAMLVAVISLPLIVAVGVIGHVIGV
jgi:uncharacterized membrane protein YphA (DoxX/SURF4 family)